MIKANAAVAVSGVKLRIFMAILPDVKPGKSNWGRKVAWPKWRPPVRKRLHSSEASVANLKLEIQGALSGLTLAGRNGITYFGRQRAVGKATDSNE
jgi:hypothetical protein